MQTNEFLNYLTQVVTPERKLVIQTAIETLMAAGNRDVEYYIDQTMHQGDLDVSTDFIDEINNLLSGAVFAILIDFGVTLDDDAPLAIAADILKGLLAMDNWADPASLSHLCEQEDTTEAIFSDLLGMVGQYHETVYLPHLMRVSEALIARIDMLNQTFETGAMPSGEEREHAQQRLHRFFKKTSAPILSQALSEMLLIGGEYHAIMEPYHDAISALEPPAAATELVGFALASELSDEQLEKTITSECQGWWDDHVGAATKMQALVSAQLKEALTP